MHLLCVSGLLLICLSVTFSSRSNTGRRVEVDGTQGTAVQASITKATSSVESRDTVSECKGSNESRSSADRKTSISRQKNCAVTPYRLTVSQAGCRSRQINIAACYGRCTSYTSPGIRTGNTYSLSTRGCHCCSPVVINRKAVLLRCKKDKTVEFRRFVVEEAAQCSCSRCLAKHLQ